eukprot:762021-Hanusia_phi.AAC.1
MAILSFEHKSLPLVTSRSKRLHHSRSSCSFRFFIAKFVACSTETPSLPNLTRGACTSSTSLASHLCCHCEIDYELAGTLGDKVQRMQRGPLAAAFLSSLSLALMAIIALASRPRVLVDLSSAGAWPRVGEVLSNVKVEHPRRARAHRISKGEPLVTARSEEEAREEIKGRAIPAATQQLRYTGSYADTSYVVNAPAGDPATVYAHHSIWPAKVDPKMPYIETVRKL